MLPINIQFSKNVILKEFRRRDSNLNSRLPNSSGDAMVGLGRVELPTSPLSGVRSSHLSYRPGFTQLVELIGIEPTAS